MQPSSHPAIQPPSHLVIQASNHPGIQTSRQPSRHPGIQAAIEASSHIHMHPCTSEDDENLDEVQDGDREVNPMGDLMHLLLVASQ